MEYCKYCMFGRNCINGTWCEWYKRYVEHQDWERCERFDNDNI